MEKSRLLSDNYPDMESTMVAICAFILGATTHVLVLRNMEVEMILFQFILSLAFSLIGSFSAIQFYAESPTNTILSFLAAASSFTCGLFVSMMIYRLWFHRIRRFPGPSLAKISRFYGLYLASKATKYHHELSDMHKQYGDFIRVGKILPPFETLALVHITSQVLVNSVLCASLQYWQFMVPSQNVEKQLGIHRFIPIQRNVQFIQRGTTMIIDRDEKPGTKDSP